MDEIIEIINGTPIDIKRLHAIFAGMNPVDIAGLFEDMDKDSIGQVFRVLPKAIAAEVFAYIEPDEQQLIVENLTDKEISEIINKLFMDDTVDFIEEMPANVVKRVLQNVGVEKRKLINQILRYPEDSAGSVMTTEYINLGEDMTVAEAFDFIRKTGVNKETIYTSYVITPDRKLIGSLSAKTLMLAQPGERVSDIMEKNVIHTHTTDDQEMVAGLFKKYDLLSMPVVDNDDRLVGIVTVDDVLEIIEEESTEDIEIMGALQPSEEPYMKTGIIQLAKNRMLWLLVLMLSATVTGAVLSGFEDALAVLPILVIFIPMLMDTGGNAGSQSSTLIIRGMALGEIESKNLLEVLWKEVRIGFLCGIVLGFINFIRVYLMNGRNAVLAFAVTMSLFCTIIIAKMVGCMLPIVAKKIKVDPAIMAAPLITTIVDAASLLIYFSIAKLIFKI
ncbi:magnesium transporter [Leadbettera azotonutricia]|uniref:Magnesium transporter MgtE n=1 Tax=Leadbettera azotonutricia (strain ATCC BAA-888 / DSM 13862 / ZAS-9) TaxID=545695 RepID=F5YDZ2_LEAAZ|nr:magnesium transporter [Leadbettera azotonutricia]AEF80944.1 magnesium transporter [Leadbettera azotonutricia ZAS-9]